MLGFASFTRIGGCKGIFYRIQHQKERIRLTVLLDTRSLKEKR